MKTATTRPRPCEPVEKDLKLFSIFTGVFVTALVVSAAVSSKVAAIGPLYLPAGTILFPITFIFNDILTEVYGYERSRRIIWTGLGCQVLAILTYLIAGALPPAPFWPNQEAYSVILGFAPRVAAAGILSYFCGEFANSFVLSKMKYWEKGERGLKQGWRFVASTIVGEGVDSTVFMAVAFSGTMPPSDLTRTAVTLYTVKVVYEVVALPVSTRFADWVKSVEGIDHIDTPQSTNYNPFAVLADGGRARSCSNSTIGDA